ncbi:MAG: HAD family phosphatase, partial [Sphingobacteriaceae bacterium]|nr:HAD family phosphatase [Cytophagaceae bacterium]
NVIIDIDIPLTHRAFGTLAGVDDASANELFKTKAFFRHFENGEVPETEFKALLKREFSGETWAEADIDSAWCALLLDMPKERLDLIAELGNTYRVFLLSNTNPIHVREITRRAAAIGVDFPALFEKLYISSELGLMKPDPAIYEHVLADSGLVTEETLFIDDNLDNLLAANALGIHTLHLDPIGSLLEKMKPYLV